MLTAFTAGLLLITISELGDKTFCIAAIMALRHPRRLVFIAVVAALVAMTLLSVLLGQAASFLPKVYLKNLEIGLFLIFGVKLLIDAWRMSPKSNCSTLNEAAETIDRSAKNLKRNKTNWAIILETFLLTFVAEWGDRTQFATITLAASNNAVGVTLGAITGHTICAAIAIIGSKMLAGRISERMVTAIGGSLFLIFAAVGMWEKS
jgi:putative Ca2+/H+ antiporter (TMEM165/GDT1 family)